MIEIRVLELLCSRLCHDLVGPMGAVNNGIELLEDMPGEAGDDALALIASSAREAAARLQFFRAAYGFAGRVMDSFADGRGLANGLLAAGKITLEWPDDQLGAGAAPEGIVQLGLNMIAVAAECLTRGGAVRVRIGDGPAPGFRVEAVGEGAAIDQSALVALSGATAIEDLDLRSVQSYFTGRLAADLSAVIEAGTGAGAVTLAAVSTT